VFIELTDHLRCPADHAEQYLVLLPDRIVDRSVISGRLGCPVCGRTYAVTDGIAELGETPVTAGGESPLEPTAIHVLLGLSGPGGYAVLVGSAASEWEALSRQNSGVALVAVNPPSNVADAGQALSILRAPLIPLKARSVRGVILGPEFAADAAWVRDAARVTLPGLRVVGQGTPPELESLELLAMAEGCWVASKRADG
jgi:uncharacterized protein YbaR (Trm112 family)